MVKNSEDQKEILAERELGKDSAWATPKLFFKKDTWWGEDSQ